MPATVDLLLRAPLFAAMPRAVVDPLAARATRRKVRAGSRVLARSDAALVLVLVGRVAVIADDGTPIRSVGPPGVFGVSLAAGAPAPPALVAAEDWGPGVIPAHAEAAAPRRPPPAPPAATAPPARGIRGLSAATEALRGHGVVARVAP